MGLRTNNFSDELIMLALKSSKNYIKMSTVSFMPAT